MDLKLNKKLTMVLNSEKTWPKNFWLKIYLVGAANDTEPTMKSSSYLKSDKSDFWAFSSP